MVQVTGDILFGICIYINDSFLLFVSSCYTCAIFILIIYYTIVQFSHLFTFNILSYLYIYVIDYTFRDAQYVLQVSCYTFT